MAADPAGLRFFVDESLMGIGKALSYARRDVIHAGHPLIPGAHAGALDPDWMPVVAAADLAVICRDRKLRTRPGEVELLRQHGLRVFYLGQEGLEQLGLLGPDRPAMGRHRAHVGGAGPGAVVHGCK
jgi:hypothetical protein